MSSNDIHFAFFPFTVIHCYTYPNMAKTTTRRINSQISAYTHNITIFSVYIIHRCTHRNCYVSASVYELHCMCELHGRTVYYISSFNQDANYSHFHFTSGSLSLLIVLAVQVLFLVSSSRRYFVCSFSTTYVVLLDIGYVVNSSSCPFVRVFHRHLPSPLKKCSRRVSVFCCRHNVCTSAIVSVIPLTISEYCLCCVKQKGTLSKTQHVH